MYAASKLHDAPLFRSPVYLAGDPIGAQAIDRQSVVSLNINSSSITICSAVIPDIDTI